MTDAPQLTAIEAGRTAVRAKLSGGAFPAALGQAIADELADAAMAPLLADLDEAQRAHIFDTAELKRENDRLRAESEQRLGELLFWHFEYQAAMDNYNGALLYTGEMHAERDRYRAQVQAVAQARCWTNEDGKDFLFADDVRAALATTAPACTCGAEPVHQAGCPGGA